MVRDVSKTNINVNFPNNQQDNKAIEKKDQDIVLKRKKETDQFGNNQAILINNNQGLNIQDKFLTDLNKSKVKIMKLLRDKEGIKKEYIALAKHPDKKGKFLFMIVQAYEKKVPRDAKKDAKKNAGNAKIDYIELNREQVKAALKWAKQLSAWGVKPKRIKKDMKKYFEKFGIGEMERETQKVDDLKSFQLAVNKFNKKQK